MDTGAYGFPDPKINLQLSRSSNVVPPSINITSSSQVESILGTTAIEEYAKIAFRTEIFESMLPERVYTNVGAALKAKGSNEAAAKSKIETDLTNSDKKLAIVQAMQAAKKEALRNIEAGTNIPLRVQCHFAQQMMLDRMQDLADACEDQSPEYQAFLKAFMGQWALAVGRNTAFDSTKFESAKKELLSVFEGPKVKADIEKLVDALNPETLLKDCLPMAKKEWESNATGKLTESDLKARDYERTLMSVSDNITDYDNITRGDSRFQELEVFVAKTKDLIPHMTEAKRADAQALLKMLDEEGGIYQGTLLERMDKLKTANFAAFNRALGKQDVHKGYVAAIAPEISAETKAQRALMRVPRVLMFETEKLRHEVEASLSKKEEMSAASLTYAEVQKRMSEPEGVYFKELQDFLELDKEDPSWIDKAHKLEKSALQNYKVLVRLRGGDIEKFFPNKAERKIFVKLINDLEGHIASIRASLKEGAERVVLDEFRRECMPVVTRQRN